MDICLGDLVFDEASETSRDVDITVTERVGGDLVKTFRGMEVKAHTRPLDVTHVEQLNAKLSDMPSLQEKGIISASGYSVPAIRKAEKHGIKLFELKQWNPKTQPCSYFSSELADFTCQAPEWCGNPRVVFEPVGEVTDAVKQSFQQDSLVEFPSGVTGSVSDLINGQVGQAFSSRHPAEGLDDDRPHQIDVLISLPELPTIRTSAGSFSCDSVRVLGTMRWKQTSQITHFRTLHLFGDEHPLAGACVFELWAGYLGGIVIGDGKKIHFVKIPPVERKQSKAVLRRITGTS